MTEKEMMLDVLNRLKTCVQIAIDLTEHDSIRDNQNPHFSVPHPYQMRIGDFLITDEKTKLFGDIATMNCENLIP